MCTFRKWVTRNPVIPSVSTADRGWVDTSEVDPEIRAGC